MKDVKPFEESEQMFQKANSKKNSSKALLKAVEIAGDIISGRVTFVEASKLWLSDDQHKKVVSKIKEYAQPSKEKPKEKGQKNALIDAEILAMVESNLEKSSNFVSGLTNIVMNPESPRVEIPIPKPARGLEKQVKSDPDTPLTQKEKNKELQKSFSGEQSAHRAFKKHIRQEITEVVDTSTPKKSREKLKKTVERSGSDTKNFKPVIGNPIIRNLELAEMAKIPSKDDQVESTPVPEVKPLGKRKVRKEKAEAVNKSKETRKQLDELKRRQVEESSINTEILEGMGNFPDEAPAGDKDNQIQLKDIIPIKDKDPHSTVSSTSLPGNLRGEPLKKENYNMIEEIRRERLVEVTEDMDSLKLFSTEQRNKIARTEADFVSCMKNFEKFNLNPEKYMNTKELFDHFLELFNKSEIHKIPSEIIYHSKFGVALSQIYEILRNNFSHIPLKHAMMLTLLDDTIKLLDKKVEDISDDLNEKFNIRSRRSEKENRMLVKRTPEILSGGLKLKPPKIEYPMEEDPLPFNHTLSAFTDSSFQNLNQHLNRGNVPSLVKTESIEIVHGNKQRVKDSKAAIIKRLLNTIEKVLMETEKPNGANITPVLNIKETDSIYNNRRLGQLPTFREKGYMRLLKAIKAKISDSVTAEHLSLGIEDKINNLKGMVLSEYLESIKSLSNEFSKAGVKQADIIRIFQASESEIGIQFVYVELILATIEGPQLFIF